MLGPIAEHKYKLAMKTPFTLAGLADFKLASIASAFWASFSGPKLTLPIAKWIIPLVSTRYSTFPALASSTALTTSVVTVPLLGLGIRPLGPNPRAYLPRRAITEGVAINTSKLIISLSI